MYIQRMFKLIVPFPSLIPSWLEQQRTLADAATVDELIVHIAVARFATVARRKLRIVRLFRLSIDSGCYDNRAMYKLVWCRSEQEGGGLARVLSAGCLVKLKFVK